MKPKTYVLRTLNQKHVLNLYMRLFNFLLIIFGKNHGSDPDPSHWSWSSTGGNWKHQEGKRRHDAMFCCQKQTIEREEIWRDMMQSFLFPTKTFLFDGQVKVFLSWWNWSNSRWSGGGDIHVSLAPAAAAGTLTKTVDPDPHSFSLTDPNPERKIFHIKTEKILIESVFKFL